MQLIWKYMAEKYKHVLHILSEKSVSMNFNDLYIVEEC